LYRFFSDSQWILVRTVTTMTDPTLTVDMGTSAPTESTFNTDLAVDTLIDESLNEDRVLATKVQRLVGGISERFVPKPSDDARLADIIAAIQDFKKDVRWKEFWRNRNKDRYDREQRTWSSHYHMNKHLLTEAQWAKSKTDPNWLWPNP
jgi:hypothetical protein